MTATHTEPNYDNMTEPEMDRVVKGMLIEFVVYKYASVYIASYYCGT